ncbi:aminotransferase class I/II-fold pyridoxal phosphate-dependent enzyme [uncultured Bacteroides sp.]|uniref:aminotransferase class I/II-fold pyridoxal phosphate-dependent enzyme n=1 Tax=uncultured Bacteroides sp. TaxID=162156 RepID=UPI0025DFEA8B|nr:aminotransferase class I/II-fold pyridoxal phosphate-dependent enzyme [uncultured Bacteroides sp.]
MEKVIDVTRCSLKDFESNGNFNLEDRASHFYNYIEWRNTLKHNTYRVDSLTGSGATMKVVDPYTLKIKNVITFVSNDYLGFSHHPKILEACINAIEDYGAGAGASPLIGGQLNLHDLLEQKIANFFEKEDAITFTAGFAANSGTLSALLGKEDIAILDMYVHASVVDGCCNTNKKFFLHNNMESLESILKVTSKSYRNRIIVVDGVYSQDGDIAALDQVCSLAKQYNAYVMVDDAHGIGIFGEKGRGVLEEYDLLSKVDFITGTFSKTFGSVGGYLVANKYFTRYLKYYSRANIFSAAATPQSAAAVIKGLELLHEEPQWQAKIRNNMSYFNEQLTTLKINHGNTASAIFPIMICDEDKTNEAAKILFDNGIYVNPITYPAVVRKQSRLRMSVLATHSKEDLDTTLNVLEHVVKKLNIKRNE